MGLQNGYKITVEKSGYQAVVADRTARVEMLGACELLAGAIKAIKNNSKYPEIINICRGFWNLIVLTNYIKGGCMKKLILWLIVLSFIGCGGKNPIDNSQAINQLHVQDSIAAYIVDSTRMADSVIRLTNPFYGTWTSNQIAYNDNVWSQIKFTSDSQFSSKVIADINGIEGGYTDTGTYHYLGIVTAVATLDVTFSIVIAPMVMLFDSTHRQGQLWILSDTAYAAGLGVILPKGPYIDPVGNGELRVVSDSANVSLAVHLRECEFLNVNFPYCRN